MKSSKLMLAILFPLTLAACEESNVDKLNKLKAEYQTVSEKVTQCGSNSDDACQKAKSRADELLSEMKVIENKLLNKALDKMNGK